MRYQNKIEMWGTLVVMVCGIVCFLLGTQIELDSKAAIRAAVHALEWRNPDGTPVSEEGFSARDLKDKWYVFYRIKSDAFYNEDGVFILRKGSEFGVKITKKGGRYIDIVVYD